MKILLLFIAGISFQICLSQSNDSVIIKKLVNETLTNGTSYENLRVLCKQVGPRLSGSTQFAKAVEVTKKMMIETGADTVYLQHCMVHHWIRGEKETGEIILNRGRKYNLKLCALGNSEGTGEKGITAPVIEVRSIAELEQLGTGIIKGKIIFFNFIMDPTHIETFRAYGESYVSRVNGPSLAGKYGAVGAIVRSLAINTDDHPHTGVTVYNDSFPKIPAVAISTNDAEYLSKELKTGNVMRAYF